MARRLVEIITCDACEAKGEEREAVTELKVGSRVWDVCIEHEEKFARPLIELLGDPLENASEDQYEEPSAVAAQ